MRCFKVFLSISIIFYQLLVIFPQTTIATTPKIVISQMQAAGAEFVEIYNNDLVDIDVTNWCVKYSSAADGTQSQVGCIKPPNSTTKVWLQAGGYATFVSPEFKSANNLNGDIPFEYLGGISDSAGHIRLFDATKAEVDKLAWGSTAAHPETAASIAPTATKILQRKSTSPGVLQDTDSNTNDFVREVQTLHAGSLYEIETIMNVCPNLTDPQATIPAGMIIDAAGNCVVLPPVDVCPNTPETDTAMPAGFLADELGDCYPDQCLNVAGLQKIVSAEYDQDEAKQCVLHDECPNITAIQPALPYGYKKSGASCVLDLLPLQLTEVLPNPAGSDSGSEFIELYNPTDRMAELSLYMLHVGIDNKKSYSFPAGSSIAPGEYKVFMDSEIKFTLVNMASQVSLFGTDGTTVAQADAYANPGDGQAWALIDGAWQYTDQPTPGAANIAPVVNDSETASTGQVGCPAGKYRNPLTNRCRNIESDAAVLAACEVDQYRNPETGRCKKVVTTGALAPCKDGQYRSEETNRCRNITTAAANLAPCKEGQERNPDTNRCRSVAAKSVPEAAYAVEPVNDSAEAFVGWAALGGVGALATGYASWEWRAEAVSLLRRFVGFFKFK